MHQVTNAVPGTDVASGYVQASPFYTPGRRRALQKAPPFPGIPQSGIAFEGFASPEGPMVMVGNISKSLSRITKTKHLSSYHLVFEHILIVQILMQAAKFQP